jgi:hypothetical protein
MTDLRVTRTELVVEQIFQIILQSNIYKICSSLPPNIQVVIFPSPPLTPPDSSSAKVSWSILSAGYFLTPYSSVSLSLYLSLSLLTTFTATD